MKTQHNISDPTWFYSGADSLGTVVELHRSGKIAQEIEQRLATTPIKRALRGIYGKGDFWVAWELMKAAVREYFSHMAWEMGGSE